MKSVRWSADGSAVGSEMERPCIVGRRLKVPRSVSVSRRPDFSLVYESAELVCLRRRSSMRHAARNAPSAMPGMNPAAKEAPENFWDFESAVGSSGVPVGATITAAAPDDEEGDDDDAVVDGVVADEPDVVVEAGAVGSI